MDYAPFLKLAIEAASAFDGATAPNPPVGAIALDSNHQILGIEAHERAGLEHAERKLIRRLKEQKLFNRLHTLCVTLEPCSHTGRTPPCADFLIENKIKNLVFGCFDPSLKVNGQGIAKLKAAGMNVIGPVLELECKELIQAFTEIELKNKPWISLKTAHRLKNLDLAVLGMLEFTQNPEFATSMIPKAGEKTFSRFPSIQYAHRYRKKSQAILTTMPTLEKDEPLFTVRAVSDHDPPPERLILVCGRNPRPPTAAFDRHQKRLETLGFKVLWTHDPLATLKSAPIAVQRVLIEAGPTFSLWALRQGWVNEHIRILHTPSLDLIQKVTPFQGPQAVSELGHRV
jgi:diaminohydroxyphosphoribosylaminopyrimidine deaminase/5-amino-6-(5-phosphoribosylamino)uracil reductase